MFTRAAALTTSQGYRMIRVLLAYIVGTALTITLIYRVMTSMGLTWMYCCTESMLTRFHTGQR